MRICAISDTHGLHDGIVIPECDVLVHAGDFTSVGNFGESMAFLAWFLAQKPRHKVLIPGNHEVGLERNPTLEEDIFHACNDGGAYFLVNRGCEIEGRKFWGSPYTPPFGTWAYMAEEPRLEAMYHRIPADTEVLVTHGPAISISDMTLGGINAGSLALYNFLRNRHMTVPGLRAHVFGHIHETRGMHEETAGNIRVGTYISCNASMLDAQYRKYDGAYERPHVFDI